MKFSRMLELAKASGNKIIEDTFEEFCEDDINMRFTSINAHSFIAWKPKLVDGIAYNKVYYLVVDELHQRKGYGRALLAKVPKPFLFVTEEFSAGYYLAESIGLRIIGREPNEFCSFDCLFVENSEGAEAENYEEAAVGKVMSENNGGPTDYYDLDPSWEGAGDIIEGRGMNFNQGSMLKVAFCFGVGRHEATNYERELNKLIYFAGRELERIGKEK